MKTAQELLDDFRNTKRASCMSEYEGWIKAVIEYLERDLQVDETLNKLAKKNPEWWSRVMETPPTEAPRQWREEPEQMEMEFEE